MLSIFVVLMNQFLHDRIPEGMPQNLLEISFNRSIGSRRIKNVLPAFYFTTSIFYQIIFTSDLLKFLKNNIVVYFCCVHESVPTRQRSRGVRCKTCYKIHLTDQLEVMELRTYYMYFILHMNILQNHLHCWAPYNFAK